MNIQGKRDSCMFFYTFSLKSAWQLRASHLLRGRWRKPRPAPRVDRGSLPCLCMGMVASLLIASVSGCRGRADLFTRPQGRSHAAHGSVEAQRALTQAHPWWDVWPRPTVNSTLSKVQAFHANMVVGSQVAPSDEGRGPYFRAMVTASYKNLLQQFQSHGIHVTGYMEGIGEVPAFVGALHQLSNGTFLQDPRLHAAKMISHVWLWDDTGPVVNPKANTVVWFGMQSFANSEPWLGPFTLSHSPSVRLPTYPDGRPATGYENTDSSDPRHARFYDALAAKGIDGALKLSPRHDFPTRNFTGLPLYDFGGTRKSSGYISFGKDVAAPFWLDYQKAIVEYHVQHGGEGMWSDNATGWDFIGNQPTIAAFGDWSVAQFRVFLAGHPEIPVPGTAAQFNIVTYLQDRLLAWFPNAGNAVHDPKYPGWSDERFLFDPLWRAFLAFKAQTAQSFMQSSYEALRRAAAAAGKDPGAVYLGGNDMPSATYGALNGTEMSQVNTEFSPNYLPDVDHFGRSYPPNGHTGPFYATAVSLERSQHAIVWYYLTDAAYRNKPHMGELLGFEALANNVLLNTDTDWGQSPGTAESIAFVNATIERLAPVLGYRLRQGSVALVFGSFTQATGLAPGGNVGIGAVESVPGRFSHLDHSLGFAGWGEALEERHVPYRVIPDYKLPHGLPPDVSVLILPHIRSLDPATVQNVLIPFAKAGGTILVTGSDAGMFQTRDFAYRANPSPILADLTTQPLTPGRALLVDGNPGFDFYLGNRGVGTNEQSAPQRKEAARNKVETILASLEQGGGLRREIDLGNWGGCVWVTAYADKTHTKYFYDFLNVNFDARSDTFTPTAGGTATFALPAQLADRQIVAQFYDADRPAETRLPVTSLDSTSIAISMPSFRVYGTLVLTGKVIPYSQNIRIRFPTKFPL
jgi:hypothetical protein